MSEIRIHRSLHHSNIVGFEHFFEDAENVYILLELCTNQVLPNFNHSDSQRTCQKKKKTDWIGGTMLHGADDFSSEVLACSSCNPQGVSDWILTRISLKLGNLFLTDKMQIKIGDFGLATKLDFEGEKKRTVCGTPNYIAPEILEGKSGHSYEVDIWSLGVIL